MATERMGEKMTWWHNCPMAEFYAVTARIASKLGDFVLRERSLWAVSSICAAALNRHYSLHSS